MRRRCSQPSAAVLIQLIQRVPLRDMLILTQIVMKPTCTLPGPDEDSWDCVLTEVLCGVVAHDLDFDITEAAMARVELRRRIDAGKPAHPPVTNWRLPGVPAWPEPTTVTV